MRHDRIWLADARQISGYVQRLTGTKRAASPYTPPPLPPYDDPSLAVIAVNGLLVRDEWTANDLRDWGISATSYEALEQEIRNASGNDAIATVMMIISSGGGMVSGLDHVLGALADLRSSGKRLLAAVDGFAASAAYWIASQADVVSATSLAEVGGIGCFAVILDASQMMSDMGVKVHVIRSAPLKGAGVFGAPLPEGFLESEQSIVDAIGARFVESVRTHRRFSETALSGGVFLAADAQRLGLIDLILDDVVLLANEQDLMEKMEMTRELEQNVPPICVGENEFEGDQPAAEPEAPDQAEPDPVDPETDADADDAANDDEDVLAAERERCAKIVQAYAQFDPAFAAHCIEAGLTVEASKALAWDRKIGWSGCETGALSGTIRRFGSDDLAGEPAILVEARHLAAQENIPLYEAFGKIAKTRPDEAAAYYMRPFARK